MNLSKLFETQKILRDRIGYNEPDKIYKLILALLVELGECANEVRCFKFWSQKPASEKKIILEEFVDGLHFILDQGIEIDETDIEYFPEHVWKEEDILKQFILVFKYAALMEEDNYYIPLFHSFIYLGELLGFTWEEVERAYMEKNRINHERQDSGVY